jgi:hypothetical protein
VQDVGGLKAALGYAPSMFMFLSPRDCRPFVPALPAGEPRKRVHVTCAPQPFQQKIPCANSHATTTCRPQIAGANLPPAGDSYVSLPSSAGTLRMSVGEWIDLAAAAAPDAVVMLSDEISSVATGGSSRTRKSIDRSGQWFVQQLAELRTRPSLRSTAVFAAVQGGNSSGNRARACSSIAAMKVDGVVIGGLNTGEEREERCGIIKATVGALPAHLPRMLSSVGGPEDMLDAGAPPPPSLPSPPLPTMPHVHTQAFASPNPNQSTHLLQLLSA